MIKYRLKCKKCQKTFDSWFSTSKEYEKLKIKNFLNCHFCNSKNIVKTLMAPSILSQKRQNENLIKKDNTVKKKILEFQKFIEKNFEYVGNNFTKKVREIYYDKKNSKTIYGTTTPKEREELADEGIELLSIPWINKDN